MVEVPLQGFRVNVILFFKIKETAVIGTQSLLLQKD